MFAGISSLGLFLLVTIAYFFYTYPQSNFSTELNEQQRVEFHTYMNLVRKTWLESLIIGFSFAIVLYLVIINKKINL
jgi:hypothetical protein